MGNKNFYTQKITHTQKGVFTMNEHFSKYQNIRMHFKKPLKDTILCRENYFYKESKRVCYN